MIKNFTSLSSLVPVASNILWTLLWLTLLRASAPQTFAQGGIPLWTNRYNGPANFGDLANAAVAYSGTDVEAKATAQYSGDGLAVSATADALGQEVVADVMLHILNTGKSVYARKHSDTFRQRALENEFPGVLATKQA